MPTQRERERELVQKALQRGMTPDKIKEAVVAYRQQYGPKPPPPPTATQQADQASAERFKPSFAADTTSPKYSEAFKTVGNVPSSAINFGKNVIKALNPINTVKNLAKAAEEARGLVKDAGGVWGATKAFAGALPEATFETFLPDSAQALIKAGASQAGLMLAGDKATERGKRAVNQDIDEQLLRTQRSLTNDPFGQIAPWILTANEVAKGLDKRAWQKELNQYKQGTGRIADWEKSGGSIADAPRPANAFKGGFDKTMTAIASPVTKPAGAVINVAKNLAKGTARFGASQATGLSPKTIDEVIAHPERNYKNPSVSRQSIGQEVQSALDRRVADLDDTGKQYAPIREGNVMVRVDPAWLDDAIKDATKADLLDDAGKHSVRATGSSFVRSPADVAKIQQLHDFWEPYFQKGQMTGNEFLNFRADLAKIAKYDGGIGKSLPLDTSAKMMRGSFNQTYRSQVPGLDKLDDSFSSEIRELKELKAGLVDRNGNLTPSAVDRIANSTGNTAAKNALLSRLETLSPGIAEKVRYLRAVEDIQHASGLKVGLYSRSLLIGGGFLAGGPFQAIITAILTDPAQAVPILQKYGVLKNAKVVQTVQGALLNAAKQVNHLPDGLNAPIGSGATQAQWLSVINEAKKSGNAALVEALQQDYTSRFGPGR